MVEGVCGIFGGLGGVFDGWFGVEWFDCLVFWLVLGVFGGVVVGSFCCFVVVVCVGVYVVFC